MQSRILRPSRLPYSITKKTITIESAKIGFVAGRRNCILKHLKEIYEVRIYTYLLEKAHSSS